MLQTFIYHANQQMQVRSCLIQRAVPVLPSLLESPECACKSLHNFCKWCGWSLTVMGDCKFSVELWNIKRLWTQHATVSSMFLKQVLPLSLWCSFLEGLTFAVRPSDQSNLTMKAFMFCAIEFSARFLRLTGWLYLDIILVKEISKYSAHLSICFCLRGLKQNGKKFFFYGFWKNSTTWY